MTNNTDFHRVTFCQPSENWDTESRSNKEALFYHGISLSSSSSSSFFFFAPSKIILKKMATVQVPGRKFDDQFHKFAVDWLSRDNGYVIDTDKQRKGNFPCSRNWNSIQIGFKTLSHVLGKGCNFWELSVPFTRLKLFQRTGKWVYYKPKYLCNRSSGLELIYQTVKFVGIADLLAT